jgi:hypothetical protein
MHNLVVDLNDDRFRVKPSKNLTISQQSSERLSLALPESRSQVLIC